MRVPVAPERRSTLNEARPVWSLTADTMSRCEGKFQTDIVRRKHSKFRRSGSNEISGESGCEFAYAKEKIPMLAPTSQKPVLLSELAIQAAKVRRIPSSTPSSATRNEACANRRT